MPSQTINFDYKFRSMKEYHAKRGLSRSDENSITFLISTIYVLIKNMEVIPGC